MLALASEWEAMEQSRHTGDSLTSLAPGLASLRASPGWQLAPHGRLWP